MWRSDGTTDKVSYRVADSGLKSQKVQRRKMRIRARMMKTKKWRKFMFYAREESFDSLRNYVET